MIEVDQSIKIEQAHADTRIGIVKGNTSILVLVDARLKRVLLKPARLRGVRNPHMRLLAIILWRHSEAHMTASMGRATRIFTE